MTIYSLLVVVSPSMAGDPDWETGAVNATLVGVLLIGLAGFELVHLYVWTDVGQLLLGLWLAISPNLLGYAADGRLGRWHVGLGAVLALLGLLSLVHERHHRRRCT